MTQYFNYIKSKSNTVIFSIIIVLFSLSVYLVKVINVIVVWLIAPQKFMQYRINNILYENIDVQICNNIFQHSNYLPTFEINLPFYITDITYINVIIITALVCILPIIYLFILYIYNINIYKIELKSNFILFIIFVTNYLFLFVSIYNIISPIIMKFALYNSYQIAYVELDILFQLREYIQFIIKYIILYLIYVFIVISTFKYRYAIHYNLYIILIIITLSLFTDVIGSTMFIINISLLFLLIRFLINTATSLFNLKLNFCLNLTYKNKKQ